MSKSTDIRIEPALPTDLYAIGALECLTFYDEPFSAVAFGPTRDSVKNLTLCAQDRAKPPKRKGQTNRVVKAVSVIEQGKEEIVGAAMWFFVVGRKEGDDDLLAVDKEEKEKDEENPGGWGKGANVKFCEEIFGRGDESMWRSCEGGDYASKSILCLIRLFHAQTHPELSSLVVHPSCQRRGIGTQLLELFLKEADELGLQAVLGASKEGRGLYKRYGFVDFEIMELRMWEWEGGEDMQGVVEEHVIMHRPARAK